MRSSSCRCATRTRSTSSPPSSASVPASRSSRAELRRCALPANDRRDGDHLHLARSHALHDALDVPETERVGDFGSVEKLMVSSAPARVETKRAIMEMFPNSGLYELYGSTEAGGSHSFIPTSSSTTSAPSAARSWAPPRSDFSTTRGARCRTGSRGELYSCGPYAFDGYWNLPEKTAEAFRGPYLSVGRHGHPGRDGFIRLIDRKKNMIISGGENVYPTEVEAVLAQHPAVKDVAVVGCPDAKWGERVAAAVVLRDQRDGLGRGSDRVVEGPARRLQAPARDPVSSAPTRCRATRPARSFTASSGT
jgi:acyl-CoA synthetase (AMP-forming)/AMP-acid ligase II